VAERYVLNGLDKINERKNGPDQIIKFSPGNQGIICIRTIFSRYVKTKNGNGSFVCFMPCYIRVF